ncbi:MULTISPECIES: LPS export ABC transporter permease LptG [unclassified Psychrobacter]|uniref:LPS export ABC transporter permease LptG n=1 Tax=unclassified Psychrobacter TaxID=196806 RepID=UPI0018F40537|nr:MULTISPECIES: LPS export ABC transporter permease LptG [unclassified Psychrobacter]
MPWSELPALRVLSRYVKWNALASIVAAVAGLWALQVVFAYLSELDSLSDSYTMGDAMRFILYRSPYFLEQFMPTGALLGAVVGLGLLANKSELVVMRAAGVSIYRIVGWVLQPALVFVVLALALNQFVLPHSNQLANDINSDDGDSITSVRGYWSVQPRVAATAEDEAAGGNDILYIDYADVAGNLGTIKRWHLDDNGNLVTAIRASSGNYDGEVQVPDGNGEPQSRYVWRLNNMTELSIAQGFDSSQVQSASDTLVLPFAPKSVSLLTRDAENLSLTELYAHRQLMAEQNKRSLSHELAFWQKLLSPLSILSLVVVACSFVFGSLRTHSLGLRIVVALLFGLLFSYLQDLVGFISLATGWSPMLMVLLPIVASAGLGLHFIKRQM